MWRESEVSRTLLHYDCCCLIPDIGSTQFVRDDLLLAFLIVSSSCGVSLKSLIKTPLYTDGSSLVLLTPLPGSGGGSAGAGRFSFGGSGSGLASIRGK